MGITHWAAKRLTLWSLVQATEDKGMIRAIFKNDKNLAYDINDIVGSVSRSMKQWDCSKPRNTGYSALFLEKACEMLDTDRLTFVEAPIFELFNPDKIAPAEQQAALDVITKKYTPEHLLSDEELRQLEEVVKGNTKTDPEEEKVQQESTLAIFGHGYMHIPNTRHFTTVAEGVAKGEIDQKLFYQSTDSAAAWLNLINSEYPSYDYCKSALEQLIKSPDWIQIVKKGEHSNIVMLGGAGSPSKDAMLISHLLQTVPTETILYTILDISPHLCIDSYHALMRFKKQLNWSAEKLRIGIVHWDFMRLDELAREEVRRNNGKVIWVITAGTIGNVREKGFFSSVNTQASTDDLLIVTADTFSKDHIHDAKKRLSEKYDNESLNHFLGTPLAAVQSAIKSNVSLEHALNSIERVLEVATTEEHTDVPNSLYVEWKLKLECLKPKINKGLPEELILLRSTRYSHEGLVEFARHQGWYFISSSFGADPHFRQFLFRRQ